MKDLKPNYIEFSDPRLIAIYNTVNGTEGYKDFYLELANKLSVTKIIDIGCGSGLLTCELAKLGYEMVGVEPSQAMLDLARQSPCKEQVKWVQGDALSIEEFMVDLVIMTGHVAQFYLDNEYWLKALRSIYNALRPGGYLAFESRNPAVQPWTSNSGHIDWPSKESPRTVMDPKVGQIDWWTEVLEVKAELAVYENHYLFTKTREEIVSVNKLRFRTQEEISQSLKKTGFLINEVFGNWDKSSVNKESAEFIFVALRD